MYTTNPNNIKKGMFVEIRIDKTQDDYKRGVVKKVLSKNISDKGIKVQLTDGTQGRIVDIPTKDELTLETFKFMNQFLYEKNKIYAIWINKEQRFLYAQKNGLNITFLFSSKEAADFFIETSLASKEGYSIRELNRRKFITDQFKNIDIHLFIIDNFFKIKYDTLLDKETHFKKLLSQTSKK